MQVSREYALTELESVRKTLSGWIRDIKDPTVLEGDDEKKVYPDGVPKGLSVTSLEGIPSDQLRAELLAMSGKLEALAVAGSVGG